MTSGGWSEPVTERRAGMPETNGADPEVLQVEVALADFDDGE
jgi:hypothetical protein